MTFGYDGCSRCCADDAVNARLDVVDICTGADTAGGTIAALIKILTVMDTRDGMKRG